MAITLHLYYSGQGDCALRFAKEMAESGTLAKIRTEAGNLQYDYFQSIEGPHTILLIDSWENQEALDAHHASPMMKTLAALREKYDLHMRAERFLSDEDGVPQGDAEFLRK